MKPIVHLLNLLIFWVCGWCIGAETWAEGPTLPTGRIKVFLLAGQSNMDGRADGGLLTEEDQNRLARVRQRVELAYNRNPVAALDLTIPDESTASEFGVSRIFGPELFVGIEMAEAWPAERILLIKRSRGGTSLYGRWNPNWSAEQASVMGEDKKSRLYTDFIAYVRDVLSIYPPDRYELCAMFWVQGEQDSGVARYGSRPAHAYGQNLEGLIRAVRADLEVPHLPFILLQVGSGEVVEGMKRVAASVPRVSMIAQTSEPESPDYLPVYPPPLGHYNYDGMKIIGTKFAREYLANYADRPAVKISPPRAPPKPLEFEVNERRKVLGVEKDADPQ